MRNHTNYLGQFTLGRIRSRLALGVVLFQNRQEFLADGTSGVDRVALQALSILATSRRREPGKRAPLVTELTQDLFDAAISTDRTQVADVIHHMRQAGISNSEISDAVVPAIALRLGTAWEEDSLTFSAVTIGCARLQAVLRQFQQNAEMSNVRHPETLRNCLVIVPENAQHTLGAIVLSGQLRAAGAGVTLELGVDAVALSRMVRAMKFQAVMISAANGECHERLAALVRAARCKDVDSKICIGGGILQQGSDLIAATGTDYVSNDWQEALGLCSEGLRFGQ